MPIQERKFFIYKHNIDAKREQEMMNNANSEGDVTREYSGEALNAIASQQMQKK